MVHIIDDTFKPGKVVRTLLYKDVAELTGSAIQTANFGIVECADGSIAMKPGFADMKQLSEDVWVDC